MTVDSMELLDTIADPDTHVVVNAALDAAQRTWMYKAMQDCMICAPAQNIVTEHIGDKDMRTIWKKLKEYFAKSMAVDTRVGTLSTYLTSTRLANTRWRGMQVNFILHWKEQA